MAKENKENYLYFSAGAKSGAGSRMVPQGGGAGPRSSGDAACWPCSELLGVEPGSVTTCNANPHNPQMVVVFDAFTQTYFGGMSDLVDDASYACAITVDS